MSLTEQHGATDTRTYGADIAPAPPVQDMYAIDTIAGQIHDRTADPAVSTGGNTGQGLGGMAEPPPPGDTLYDRRGF